MMKLAGGMTDCGLCLPIPVQPIALISTLNNTKFHKFHTWYQSNVSAAGSEASTQGWIFLEGPFT